MVWYSHLFKSFPQFVMIHTVKGFSIVNERKVDVFLKFPCFLYDPANAGNLISGSSASSNQLDHMEVLSSCTAGLYLPGAKTAISLAAHGIKSSTNTTELSF